jgi:Ca-activated chloride channel family protein
MKAESFEYQLRHATPPTPDAEARLRARRAALAEFERIHAQTVEPSTPVHAGVRGVLRWPSRNALLGSVATACVVVIAVSVAWLVPPQQQGALKPPPIVTGVQSEHPRVTEADVNRQAHANGAADVSREAGANNKANANTEARSPSIIQSRPEAARNQSGRVQPGQPEPVRIEPEPAHEKPQSRVAQVRQAPPPPPKLQVSPIEPAPPEEAQSTELSEVAVTGTRAPYAAMSAPTPIAVTAPAMSSPAPAATPPPATNELGEISVTGSKRSWLSGLFSRKDSGAAVAPAPAPVAEGRDKFEHFDTNPVKRVADEPVSTFSADVDTASYSFVRRQLNERVLPQVDAVRVEEMINYFDYAWPSSDSRDEPFRPTVTVSDSPWGQGKKLIHIGIKGYELPARQQPDVNLVLLLDVSGSMNMLDKLPLAQRSMALLLDTLKPTDTVAIVVYAGAAGEVLPPTPVKDKETILEALNSLRPGGSTAGAEGIRLAYELAEKNFRKEGVNRILLATDGDFNVGITDRNELKGFVEREREKGVFLSVLGFGEGNYHDEMAQTLAQNGNGVAAYIDTLNEAKKVLVQESTASLFTIAKDVKLQVEFNPATVAEYRLVGYETRALKREDFNNDKVDAGEVGSGHAVTAIYEITPVGSKAKLIDERRYAERETTPADQQRKATEYGFLKIRYKLPNASRSRLLEQPIRVDTGVPPAITRDVEFSTAVAGFAQLLRGGKYTGSLSYDDVIRQARAGLGEDPYGYRAEFLELVQKAKNARGM